jgi:hypothetical protein
MMTQPKTLTSAFAYVYVVYYFDPNEESRFKRMHQVRPVVFTSMRRVLDLMKVNNNSMPLKTINEGVLWQSGNYWVERLAIIDSYDHGLEYEIVRHDGTNNRIEGQMPLRFA